MEEKRPLRRHKINNYGNPFVKVNDWRDSRKKFAQTDTTRKLTAIGCFERHNEPRWRQELDEYESSKREFSIGNFAEFTENEIQKYLYKLSVKGITDLQPNESVEHFIERHLEVL